jgi:hypothetical protein
MNTLKQLEAIARNNNLFMVRFLEYENKFLELTIQPPIQIPHKKNSIFLKINVGGYARIIDKNQRILINEILNKSEQNEIKKYLEKYFKEQNKNLAKIEITFSQEGVSYGKTT